MGLRERLLRVLRGNGDWQCIRRAWAGTRRTRGEGGGLRSGEGALAARRVRSDNGTSSSSSSSLRTPLIVVNTGEGIDRNSSGMGNASNLV
jgi:hypothetical protein